MDDPSFRHPGWMPNRVPFSMNAVSRTVTSLRQPSRHASGHVGVDAADGAASERSRRAISMPIGIAEVAVVDDVRDER
jgi:hypothetical protein